MTKNYQISGPADDASREAFFALLEDIDGLGVTEFNLDEGVFVASGEDFSDAELQEAASRVGFTLTDPHGGLDDA